MHVTQGTQDLPSSKRWEEKGAMSSVRVGSQKRLGTGPSGTIKEEGALKENIQDSLKKVREQNKRSSSEEDKRVYKLTYGQNPPRSMILGLTPIPLPSCN